MSFGDDEDILQDFLVEAGEILERLNQQLVDLEQRPEDKDLLNAIFRGFHTVKGGAGFLSLTPMVECCHVTENLFDILRNGKRTVTSELMDVVLQALDMVNQQFELVSQREALPPVDPTLIAALERLVSCADLVEVAPASVVTPAPSPAQGKAAPVAEGDITDEEFEQLLDAITGTPANPSTPAAAVTASSDEITEEEFESLLDQLHGKGKGPGVVVPAPAPVANTPASGNEITEDEFEALLDQLHGKGKGPGTSPAVAAAPAVPVASSVSTVSAPAPETIGSDAINEDEFEALLDQLHGKGKGPSSEANASAASVAAPAINKPAPVKASSTVAPEVKPAKSEPDRDTGKKVEPAKPAAAAADAPQVETTVRVDTQRLDDIMNMVGELVLVRNRLVRLGSSSNNEALAKAVANLDVVTADLQTSVMKTRMQPIKKVFGRFPRVVRDLARSLRKEINLELVGEETDLDKNLVEALADPLVHLVRNSVDHGIEFPDVREANGKPRTGQVVLAAEQEGDHILLSISDDGAGMDPVRLRRIAVEKGMFDEDTANRLSDTEAYNLIFAPGFSTKKEISDVSGRGVGMDVVKTKIAQLNGTVEIKSELGKGTRFVIKVPLTLAIMPTLMFMLGGQTFAFPLVSVNEIFHMDLTKSHVVDGQDCIAIRDQAIPLFYLKDWLVKGAYGEHPDNAHVVIVTVGTRRVGFVVDQLIGQEEVVIKPLGKMLQGTPGMAGATITGDGTIALILDIPSLLRRYARGSTSWGHS
ncbi:chemotaxis protein CheA [Cellvibrio japonicus]|uniref:Chemotaxis protein CheA n=1 Tax=Cellvibrio japonicus (strain Ueda107) TaxID=498211 RepID=B3PIJ8_CELJU|nr:chemotaxis protein CheA [Cellvibrio japonicus]ACE84683.1 histidine kinase [Cellvibrio japonicus Ueda107]QEI12594.1 chemotaxis protein CheA [Cellvibrio japonicus]QEI16168.1 chemotaxis protein CheA [Cellvibrio japonicus]QEI19746.1 chemotaxis protein CheA [Cellvibrio japonicus]